MGCLTAVISTAFLYDINSRIENKNVATKVSVEAASFRPEIIAETFSTIGILISNVNTGVTPEASYISQSLCLEISLVCTAGLGNIELLRVFEGDLITIDGEYITVIRNGI